MCGTDLHIIDGNYTAATYPVIPGHELAGTVVDIGPDVSHVAIGDFVVVDPVVACRYCSSCRAGRPNLCENWQGYGVTIAGGFADYVRVRGVDVVPVPETNPRHWATLVEPLSCVLHALDRLGPITPVDEALVIGAGPTGLMLTDMLLAGGAVVDVAERDEGRRNRALAFGARATALDLADFGKPAGWSIVIEASGAVAAFEAGLRAVAPSGRFHVFGVPSPTAIARIAPYEIFAKELTITGSQSLQHTFARALTVLASDRIDGNRYVTEQIPLADAARAVDNVRRGVGIKTQISPDIHPSAARP